MLRETIFYLLIVAAGTSGELCVTRAMKTIGEVTDFRSLALVPMGIVIICLGLFMVGHVLPRTTEL